MKKRILASLLSLVMVLSMFPTALAAGNFTPTDEPQQDEAVCICDALCTEGTVNTDCPVCGGEVGYTACAGTVSEPTQDEDNGIPADEGNSASETDKLLTEENVYKVGSIDELKTAITAIEESTDTEATVVLTGDITYNSGFAGVADKHVTLKSEEGKRYSIDLASELVGDLTADNVKVLAGTLYCSGHRTIFTENCEFTFTGTLYGGGNKKTVDRTYVKINGTGKINTSDLENVVVGGSYKGSVDGDIYIELAGNISYGDEEGGNYLIGTNKGTAYGGDSYTGDPLYVNGDVTLILDSPVKDTKPQNVVGAYNSHVKGNVTVQVKAGYCTGIEGMRESPTQSIVDGNIHIIAGDPAYANTDRICRIGANWDIIGAGEKINLTGSLFQVSGNVTVDTYENVWGWAQDETLDSDPPGIVGAESAEVGGDVTINVHGSHMEDIIGVDDSATSGSIVKGDIVINATDVDLRNSSNYQSGIIPVYATACKDVTVNLDGGSLSGIYGYGGTVKGNMEINITGKPVFTSNTAGVWGVNNTDTKERSVLNFDRAETSIPTVGYFTVMNVRKDSDVTLGNEEKNAFSIYDVNINTGAKLTTNKQAYSKGALTMDHGTWIANGFLYVGTTTNTQNSKLTMNDYAAFGQGYKDDSAYNNTVVTSSGDIYTFNKNDYTDKIYGNVDITGSTWKVFVPTIIGGNYKGTTNQIRLPAFVGDKNYPAEKIPLEILGTATGATQVTLVDKTNTANEGLPIVGQNYINALKVSENVFVLANNNAKADGLYFKKLADADTQNKAGYDMWQVAKGITVTFDKNGGDTDAVPGFIQVELIPNVSEYQPGVPATEPTRAGYTFKGWNTAKDGSGDRYTSETKVSKSLTVYAQWEAVAPAPTYTVTYTDGVDSEVVFEDQVTSGLSAGTATPAFKGTPNRDGYTFKGWLPEVAATVTEDVIYVAQWHKNSSGGGSGGGGSTYYILHYESNGGTEYKDERYKKNTVVELDKVPTREGYTFTGWYADEELTDRITSIKMTSDKTVYAGWEPTGVPDWLNGKDHFAYVVGYMDGTVRPLNNISRAEVATIFFRLLNEDIREENLTSVNTFADVNDGMWCNMAISTMAKLGVVKGRTAEHFDPNAPITRAEFAAICARFDTSKRTGDSDFTDISGHWAEAEIERAASLGWIMGYTDGTFRPENYITRAEAMTMINRVLNRLPEDEDDLLDGMNVWPDNKPGDWYYLAVQEATNSHDFTRKGDVHERWTKLTADPDWSRYQ